MIRARKKKQQKEEEKKSSGHDTMAPSKEDEEDETIHITGVGGKKVSGGGGRLKKRTPGEIRIQSDISELDAGDVAQVTFPDPNDLTHFNVSVSPSSGLWDGATYDFTVEIPAMYPHDPPKVDCVTQIYHPNIDIDGNVCLNILREDWKPVLGSIFYQI